MCPVSVSGFLDSARLGQEMGEGSMSYSQISKTPPRAYAEEGREFDGMRRRGIHSWGGDWRKEGVPALIGLTRACNSWRLIYHDGALPVFSSVLILLTCSLIIVPNRQKRRGWLWLTTVERWALCSDSLSYILINGFEVQLGL